MINHIVSEGGRVLHAQELRGPGGVMFSKSLTVKNHCFYQKTAFILSCYCAVSYSHRTVVDNGTFEKVSEFQTNRRLLGFRQRKKKSFQEASNLEITFHNSYSEGDPS